MKAPIRGAKGTYKCANHKCGVMFEARTADRSRGWARFCCKSCKAVVQEKRTGQYGRVPNIVRYANRLNDRHDDDDYEPTEFANAHLFSNEE